MFKREYCFFIYTLILDHKKGPTYVIINSKVELSLYSSEGFLIFLLNFGQFEAERRLCGIRGIPTFIKCPHSLFIRHNKPYYNMKVVGAFYSFLQRVMVLVVW